MGTFDNLSQDNLAAMGDALEASADLKEQAARDQLRVAKDMHSIAGIAKEMHGALVENTDTMRDMSEAVIGAAERAEDASNVVYRAVEARTVECLRDVERAAKKAVESSQANAKQAVDELESARRSMIVATVACGVVTCVACLIVFLVAVGFMWVQLKAGAEWLGTWGWAALLLSMAVCGGIGYFIAVKVRG
ncbi:hypothetical protein PMX13_09675 [Collinsella aerofaciens]|uniref:hypothetical protein n=1 Tax=Collinsella aerofaciens TaxID=74426 RepID=UPI0018A08EF7|nr:hypothetical protein [Collinsella aerofaciens]MDB1860740.1 hypothetical protein [Collinsella aerofaciens]MDB8540318.1 hypothetical protein [Escherichia coli]